MRNSFECRLESWLKITTRSKYYCFHSVHCLCACLWRRPIIIYNIMTNTTAKKANKTKKNTRPGKRILWETCPREIDENGILFTQMNSKSTEWIDIGVNVLCNVLRFTVWLVPRQSERHQSLWPTTWEKQIILNYYLLPYYLL